MKTRLIILVYFLTFIFAIESKIVAFDGDIDDRFGKVVSLSDDWFAIGANRDDDNGANSGSVYLYKYNENSIISEQKITAYDGYNNDYFGKSLAIYDDWLVVSSLYDDVNGEKSGSVYIYKLIADFWSFHSKIVPPDGAPFDRYGYAVDINNDFLVVSAVYDDDFGEDAGSVYVYRLNDDIWSFETKLYSDNISDNDFFGICVAIEQHTIVVGAIYDENIGSVTLFNYDNDIWLQNQLIIPEDGQEYDLFGSAIDLYGEFLVVGSFHDDNIYNNSGSVYIYKNTGILYEHTVKITPFDESINDNFGQAVSIYKNYISVGSNNDDNGINSGSVYIFNFENEIVLEEIKYTPEDISDFDEFSGSVSLYGNNLLVGAQYDDDLGESSGSAYLLTYKGCSNELACNYEQSFIADDSECEYPENGFSCDGECNEIIDDCGVCGGNGNDGDVNYDLEINILDVILLLGYIIDSNTYSLNTCVGDLNANSVINITDIVILLNLILDF